MGGAPHAPAGFRGLAGDQLDVSADWSDSAGSLGSDRGLDDMHLVVRQEGAVGAVRAVGGAGASVTGLSWSADGGTTWSDAELTDGVAVVDAPADASVISLRATASNTAGETVTETVREAYLPVSEARPSLGP